MSFLFSSLSIPATATARRWKFSLAQLFVVVTVACVGVYVAVTFRNQTQFDEKVTYVRANLKRIIDAPR